MTKKKNIVKSTSSGRLYITTEDFFQQEKVQETIKELLNSDIVKDIEDRKNNKIMEVELKSNALCEIVKVCNRNGWDIKKAKIVTKVFEDITEPDSQIVKLYLKK